MPCDFVLHLREVRIAQFDQSHQRSLTQDVQEGPLDIMPEKFLLHLQLLPTRCESLLSPDIQDKIGKATQEEVKGNCEDKRHHASREILVEEWPRRTKGLPVADQERRMTVVRTSQC